ncbi:murein biosynthesis integral membrane protein MurJ [Streptomyces griseoviridis]|uniref:murein biosynthesis integral membrane protein MurJ n=1 Tax=Streptomyces griseoviridis TaxID=45398 RepID=UPI003F53F980
MSESHGSGNEHGPEDAATTEGAYADSYWYTHDAYRQDAYQYPGAIADDPAMGGMHAPLAQPSPLPDVHQAAQSPYAFPPPASYTPDPHVGVPIPDPQQQGSTWNFTYDGDGGPEQSGRLHNPAFQVDAGQYDSNAFAHLYQDQRSSADGGVYGSAVPAPAASEVRVTTPSLVSDATDTTVKADGKVPGKPGRATSLLKSSAVMALGTIVSRATGFLRTLVMASAIGVGTLNDTYQVANTLPTMIYVLVGGGALNSVFIPQLVRAMKDDEDGGEAYANRLLTLVMVLMATVTAVCFLGARPLISMLAPTMTADPKQMEVAVAFARYCLPTMFFMGVHVVMGQVLNARGRFGAMMWTPVLNNVIIIITFGGFIWAFGTYPGSGVSAANLSPEGVRLLGVGTLLGLVVQAGSMVPYLRETGFRIRLRFDWRGQGLGKAAALAKWTLFFVLANQIGLIVVTELATWAGSVAEKQGYTGTGITAYNYALLLWQMPQAVITVSLMTAALPRLSRAAIDGDIGAMRLDISGTLRTSAVAIVPCAFGFLALGVPMTNLLYGGSGESGAQNIGYALSAFGLGLIPYSMQYVVLRGFYAFEDTRTPFYNTVIIAFVNAAASAVCFYVLPARWAVVGMAASYGLAYGVGVGVAWRRLRKRLGGDLDDARVRRTYARLCAASIPAALVGGAVGYLILHVVGSGVLGGLFALFGGGIVLVALFYVAARRLRIEELNATVGMLRARLGR